MLNLNPMKVALAQIQSTSSLEENLKKMEGFIQQACSKKAELIVFPEMAYFTGKKEALSSTVHRYDEIVSILSQWAKNYQIALVPGTLREPYEGDPKRYFNTLLLFDSQGKTLAKYQKIFLFEASLPHHTYQEIRFCKPGNQIVTAQLNHWCLGFAICFDIRFPELFRSLKKRGSQVFIVPSAFTVPTGEAHWEVLLRTRAIENQAYVVAVDQTLTS